MWLPSLEVLVLVGILLLIAAIAVPGLLSSQRASNERSASTLLKTITSAEADFRANDRDGNHVNDFWTGDVSGLYYVVSPETKAEVRLVDASVANADARPLFPLPKRTVPVVGYLYQAMDRDLSVKGADGEYKADTDKSGRKVHHRSLFGFVAFPEGSGKGKYQFMVNENNTIFRWKVLTPRTTWPDDEELKRITSPCEDD